MVVPKGVILAEYLASKSQLLAFVVGSRFDEPEVVRITASTEESRRFAEGRLGVLAERRKIPDRDVSNWQDVAGMLGLGSSRDEAHDDHKVVCRDPGRAAAAFEVAEACKGRVSCERLTQRRLGYCLDDSVDWKEIIGCLQNA